MKYRFPALLLALAAGCASQTTTDTVQPAQPGAAAASAAQPGQASATPQRAAPARAAGTQAPGQPPKGSVYFEYDQADIKAEYRPLIESYATYLRQRPQTRTTVQGHADERGSREYNLALGQRRSEAVKRMLLLQGVQEKQVEAISFGEEKPVGLGHDEQSWFQNRRSDLVYE